MDRYRVEAEPVTEPEEMNDAVLPKNGKRSSDELRRLGLFHDVVIGDLATDCLEI
jgi:hypothetical protein